MIATTVCNLVLHKVIDLPNAENKALLTKTKDYRRLLWPDILIKVAALILSLTVYPPIMMYGVLFAATYMQLSKAILIRKRG